MGEFEGLNSKEAEELLAKYGPNKLPEKPPPGAFATFIDQLKNPLVYILIIAAAITFFLKEFTDTIVILLAVFVNTVLGFVQERRANNALRALKMLVNPESEVIRDGEFKEINAEKIVPGDIVVLNQGDKVPADGDLVQANRLYLTEAMLTGESLPVSKGKGDEVYMGTVVSGGRAFMKVTKTGAMTKMGEIASSVQEIKEDTPMKRQLKFFSKQLTFIVLGLSIFVFLAGSLLGFSLSEIFKTSVALAVSAIPEGLLVALTVVLAIGMQRIIKRKGLVRHLVSAETLGGVTLICTDKTGTLTEGKMTVVSQIGDKQKLAAQAVIANDLDDPMVTSLFSWGKKFLSGSGKTDPDKLRKRQNRLDTIPFSSQERFFAALSIDSQDCILYVNGAPEFVSKWCGNLSREQKKEIHAKIDELTSQGMRLIAMAQKKVSKSKSKIKRDDIKDLDWIGIIALNDPVRKGVKNALDQASSAGIDVVVITGDYAKTAVAVMKQVGLKISDEQIVLGDELAKMKDSVLAARLKRAEIKLFARTTPSQKLKIVNAAKSNGEVVAMMGDGVNDAPALSKSDIGVVVGDATDVAKESADLILLDSSFATIIAAVEEGRGIFDNLRKIILYLMSDSFSAIFAVLGSLIFGLPLPLTASQILWINLVSDGVPYLALTIDPKRPDIMKTPPRDPKERLVSSWVRDLIALISVLTGIAVSFVFYVFYTQIGDLALARSVSFATLGVTTLMYVFSVRTLTKPMWRQNPFENKWLLLAVFVGFLIFVTPFAIPQFGYLFKIKSLSIEYWSLVIGTGLAIVLLIEISKAVFRRRLESHK